MRKEVEQLALMGAMPDEADERAWASDSWPHYASRA